jgi:Flp pilus assembly protein TadG
MKRALLLLLLLAGSFALTGCVASMAAGALGAAAQAASPKPQAVTEDRRAAAIAGCQTRAGGEERSHVIDAEQRGDGQVTVWGTLEEAQGRKSFECRWDGRKIAGFKVRAIAAR